MKKRVNRHPDHAKRHNTPSPNNQVIAAHLEELLTPAIFNQQAYYRQLGLRNRILNLSLMVAAVLTLLWRQVPSVQELTRLLEREDLLWCRATKIAQQSLSQRLLEFPASIFERVFKDLLPVLQSSWQQRQKRPIPESISFASRHFNKIWVADGSTLEALFRKLKSLEEVKPGQLAGKICTVVDLITRLPVQVWFHTNPLASETKFEDVLLSLVSAKTLLLLDRGFYHFQFFEQLMSQQVDFITRLKAKGCVRVIQTFTSNNSVKDELIN